MWVEANSKYKRYQHHSARVLHLGWFKSLGTFREASRLTLLYIWFFADIRVLRHYIIDTVVLRPSKFQKNKTQGGHRDKHFK